ncbi:MAG: hypothetical protein AAF567_22545 [Actinomycetota bacterium]
MSISERDRRAIYDGLEPILGPDVTDSLLAMLPHQPATELVTRADLHATTTMLRGEMAELRAELKGDMAELRGEMAELRAELKDDMAELRVSFQRWMTGAMTANTVAVVTALLT